MFHFLFQIDGGSDWVALSRPFVEYVTAPEKDELVNGLLSIFKHTLLPAEVSCALEDWTILKNNKNYVKRLIQIVFPLFFYFTVFLSHHFKKLKILQHIYRQ